MIFAGALQSPALFYLGAAGIGLGGGTFGISTLTAAITLPSKAAAGLALCACGAAQSRYCQRRQPRWQYRYFCLQRVQ